MNHHKIEIIAFSEVLQEHIKTLNYEWLEHYFQVEKNDIISLSNPKKEIIDKGGFIFYAKLNDEIVGTSSLLKKNETIFELGKMGVSKKSTRTKNWHHLIRILLRFRQTKTNSNCNFIFKYPVRSGYSSLSKIWFF